MFYRSLCFAVSTTADRGGILRQLLKFIDELGADAIQGSIWFCRKVPKTHLFQVISRRMSTLTISPCDEGEQRPPGVADERNPVCSSFFDRLDRFLEPLVSFFHTPQ